MFADLCYRIDKGADHSLRQCLKIGLTGGLFSIDGSSGLSGNPLRGGFPVLMGDLPATSVKKVSERG